MPEKKTPAVVPKPNCLYHELGCSLPGRCSTCGFDRDEAERRKKIPLTKGPDGLWRKNIGRMPDGNE